MIRRSLAALALTLLPPAAKAHVSEQGFVLLLPTDLYILGGVATVALTVLLLTIVPAPAIARLFRPLALNLPRLPILARLTGFASLAALLLLVATGLFGPTDPMRNPLTLSVWTVFWIGIVAVQALVFDVWRWINPFIAAARLGASIGIHPPFRTRLKTGKLPALLMFLAFAGFLLADPAPTDPPRLAAIALAYVAATLAATWAFGPRWLVQGEFLTVLMRTYARVAPFGRGRLGLPGWRILKSPVPGNAFAVFMLCLLGSGSFDGLNETFWWLQILGVNPLEFPGRSAIITPTLLGLLAMNAALVLAYALTIRLGARLAGGASFTQCFRTFAPSILPIAAGYHVAHYLASFLVDIQYVQSLTSTILGGPELHVTTGFFNTLATVRVIWLTQAGAVIIGHVLAILVAHALALRLHGDHRRAMLSQLPLALFMVAYTLFGLWLLASPRGV
jgi:hypothetical protein